MVNTYIWLVFIFFSRYYTVYIYIYIYIYIYVCVCVCVILTTVVLYNNLYVFIRIRSLKAERKTSK